MKRFALPLVLLAIVGGMIAVFAWGNSAQPAPGAGSDAKIEGLKTYNLSDRAHVAEEVKYEQSPPAGGAHAAAWLNCNGQVYTEPVDPEMAVHGLEHGAVWITYQPGLAADEVNRLAEKVRGKNYSFLSPYEGLNDKIVLTAWNNQLSVDSAGDSRIDKFLMAFRQGAQTPEPGASCDAPTGDMPAQ
jgi:hypothetical protein